MSVTWHSRGEHGTVDPMKLRTRHLRSSEIYELTGLRGSQFGEVVRRLWDLRPDTQRGRPWHLSFPDRVLMATMYLRTNLTERQLAVLFDVSQKQVDRVLHNLVPVLGELFGPPPTDRRELWIVDGTLIPTRDHTKTALCKNYRRSVNVQVVVRRRDRTVVTVSEAWPGNRNDSVVFKETVGSGVARHRRLIGDGGYQGVVGVTPPRRGPGGRIVRDAAWRRFRKRRATVEHVLAELKVWSVLRDCRWKGPGIDQSVRAVAALHNLRIELRVLG